MLITGSGMSAAESKDGDIPDRSAAASPQRDIENGRGWYEQQQQQTHEQDAQRLPHQQHARQQQQPPGPHDHLHHHHQHDQHDQGNKQFIEEKDAGSAGVYSGVAPAATTNGEETEEGEPYKYLYSWWYMQFYAQESQLAFEEELYPQRMRTFLALGLWGLMYAAVVIAAYETARGTDDHLKDNAAVPSYILAVFSSIYVALWWKESEWSFEKANGLSYFIFFVMEGIFLLNSVVFANGPHLISLSVAFISPVLAALLLCPMAGSLHMPLYLPVMAILAFIPVYVKLMWVIDDLNDVRTDDTDQEVLAGYFIFTCFAVMGVVMGFFSCSDRLELNVQGFILRHKWESLKDHKMAAMVREEVVRQKREYVAQTLYDVGTPLASFAFAIENLKAAKPMNQEYLDILRTCECAIELMTLTRRKAIAFAKYTAGKELLPRLTSTNIRELMETKCHHIVTGFDSASAVPIRYDIDPSIAKYVVTDAEILWECMVNYLSNAVKFTNQGEIQCNVFKVTPNYLRFEVRDRGVGIPHELKHRLFQPFTQLQKFAGGTGLGLWSVKQKITALKGEVGVHDNPGGGAVFFFDVPYQPDHVLESAINAMNKGRDRDDNGKDPSFSSIAGGGRGGGGNGGGEGGGLLLDDGSSYRSQGSGSTGSGRAATKAVAGGGGVNGGYHGNLQNRRILVCDERPSAKDDAMRCLGIAGVRVDYAANGLEGLSCLEGQQYTAALISCYVPFLPALQVVQKFRDFENSASSGRTTRQFICVTFSEKAFEADLNAAINSGADAVWEDPDMPELDELMEIVGKYKEEQEAAASRKRAEDREKERQRNRQQARLKQQAAAAAAGGGGSGNGSSSSMGNGSSSNNLLDNGAGLSATPHRVGQGGDATVGGDREHKADVKDGKSGAMHSRRRLSNGVGTGAVGGPKGRGAGGWSTGDVDDLPPDGEMLRRASSTSHMPRMGVVGASGGVGGGGKQGVLGPLKIASNGGRTGLSPIAGVAVLEKPSSAHVTGGSRHDGGDGAATTEREQTRSNKTDSSKEELMHSGGDSIANVNKDDGGNEEHGDGDSHCNNTDVHSRAEDEGMIPQTGAPRAGNEGSRRKNASSDGVRRVLVVEHEESILKYEKKMFEMHGFVVHSAPDGREGLQLLKSRLYSGVFTDVLLPMMDGYEMVRRFRQWESDVAESGRNVRQMIFAVSANTSQNEQEMARKLGFDGFANKPINESELLDLVNKGRGGVEATGYVNQ